MASDRFPPTPGFFGILCGVSLSILAGALLAAAHLIAKPVEVLTAEPKEREPGTVYFITGVRGGDWETKVATLSNPGARVRFSEGELNGWGERLFERYRLKSSDGTPEGEAEAKALARGLNLRFVEEDLQVGFSMDRLIGSPENKLVVQMLGRFEDSSSGWGYVPTTGYLGSLPLHKVPGALAVARSYFKKWAPELAKASSVAVNDGVLVVTMP